jgi:hypothetical protein
MHAVEPDLALADGREGPFSRSDFTSVPVSAMPVSKRSSTK